MITLSIHHIWVAIVTILYLTGPLSLLHVKLLAYLTV